MARPLSTVPHPNNRTRSYSPLAGRRRSTLAPSPGCLSTSAPVRQLLLYNCNTLHIKELEYTALLLSIELTSHKSQDAEHRVSASLARVSSLHSSISSLCVRPCSRAAKHEYHPDPQHEDRSSRIVLTDLDSRADEHTGRREAITREHPFRY